MILKKHLKLLAEEHVDLLALMLGTVPGAGPDPDVTIAPDGRPYLYRWHLVPRNKFANVYLHLQVESDPERPLHDHPWDNTSVILAGGYDEVWDRMPGKFGKEVTPDIRKLRTGDTVFRRAEEAHRLILPPEFPYTITLFTTGKYRRRWGFWFPGKGWVHSDEVIEEKNGKSVFKAA